MRVSIRPNDSGFRTFIHHRNLGLRPIVKLNGEPQFYAITADDEAGVVVRYGFDVNGDPIYDQDRQCLIDEVIHGKVEIEFMPTAVL